MKSISNRQLTLLRKLHKKKYREKNQLFTVEGERAVEQIIENGVVRVKHLFGMKASSCGTAQTGRKLAGSSDLPRWAGRRTMKLPTRKIRRA
ncbi:MAG: hypothetical protein U5K69_05295 [Balneolaceae bacterium]|nr:hypothetical protein [Balneolaceae bacterium]